jgi:hypothetical protein
MRERERDDFLREGELVSFKEGGKPCRRVIPTLWKGDMPCPERKKKDAYGAMFNDGAMKRKVGVSIETQSRVSKLKQARLNVALMKQQQMDVFVAAFLTIGECDGRSDTN